MKSRLWLERRRKKLARRPAPLTEVVRGTLVDTEIRCGKPTCRCVRGARHPSRYLVVTVAPRRNIKVTVPNAFIPLVRTWIRNHRRWRDLLEDISAINRELLRHRWVSPTGQAPGRAGRNSTKKR
jgi:hypothetical protein